MINGENGIIRSYLKKGVSGWRLDVADELREEFLRELYTAVKKEKSDALVLGEVWEDASNKIAYGKRRRYFRGELDSVMNYPFKEGIVSYILYSDSDALYRAVNEIYSHYPKEVSDSLMNHIGTHDTARILTVLSGRNISGTHMAHSNFRVMPICAGIGEAAGAAAAIALRDGLQVHEVKAEQIRELIF
jgi:glycosidase